MAVSRIDPRSLDKRVQLVTRTETVTDGQVAQVDSIPIERWAHMYVKAGRELDKNSKNTSYERVHWRLRYDSTLMDTINAIIYNNVRYEVTLSREVLSGSSTKYMEMICDKYE